MKSLTNTTPPMKSMKTPILALLVFAIGSLFFACSDNDDTKPITFKDYDETPTAFTLFYTQSNETGYSIPLQGGDGNYSVKSDKPEIVAAKMISSIDLSLQAMALGETRITISDNSQNTLVLTITVGYRSHNFVVKMQDIQVVGGDLTENEKKAIREKYLTQIPVKVGGGYKFIDIDYPNKKGKAIIYADTFGSKGVETTFEYVEIKREGISSTWGFEVLMGSEKRTFVLDRYTPSTKSSPNIPIALIEDITLKVQKEYPKAERVFTSQVVETPAD